MDYKLIDTAGQITAIIIDKIVISELPRIAISLMAADERIEQVGYLDNKRFAMMGGELSVNGLLAAAFLCPAGGRINGCTYTRIKNVVSVSLPRTIIKKIMGNQVILEGIVYEINEEYPETREISGEARQKLQGLAKYAPASGIIYTKMSSIKPLIYVKGTNSYVWENACGSGSLAYALITGRTDIIQPSGKVIRFRMKKKTITVTASVKEL